MTKRSSVCLVVGLVAAIFVLAGGGEPGGRRVRAADKPNACGCFRDSVGSCSCTKKAKCGCPGDCEPKGCEEKRAKQIDKEIEAETKKAASAGNKHAAVDTKESASGAGDDSGDDGDAKQKAKGGHLSAKQKKQLAKLLDAYLTEHPDQGGRTVDQVRSALTSD